MSRRIGIDGFNLALRRGSGIATYGRNLGTAVRALGHETHVLYGPEGRIGKNRLLNEVALYDEASPGPRSTISKWTSSTFASFSRKARRIHRSGEVLPSPAGARFIPDVAWAAQDVFHRANRAYAKYKRFTKVTLADGAGAPELMHWTAPLPLRTPGMANVYTIHDLVPLRLPFTTLDNKRRFYFLCKQICRRADHILTVSESARQDIIRIFGVPEDRITNAYQSVSLPPALTSRTDEDVAAEIEGMFGLDWKRYFLFFGAVEPKKNLGRIIEAYLVSGATDPLVIIGGSAWLDEDETRLLYKDIVVVQAVQENMIRRADRIRRYDYMPLATLVSLIRGAKATLFPSLYEGFGLPVLESMMLGTPVLTSSAGSLPEVAGDAALVVDPYDTQAIKRGIQALDADAGLRADLAERGRLQAARFSPQIYQDRIAGFYEQILR